MAQESVRCESEMIQPAVKEDTIAPPIESPGPIDRSGVVALRESSSPKINQLAAADACLHSESLRSSASGSSKGIRITYFVLPFFAGILLSVFVSFVQWLRTDDARRFIIGLDGMQIPLLALAIIGVVMFFVAVAAPRARTPIIATGIMFLLLGSFAFYFVRFDGFYGNRFPKLAWRTTPLPDATLRSYLTSTNREIDIGQSLEIFTPTAFDVPGFQGADRIASVHALPIAENWSDHPPKLLWRHPVGLSWSSFAVVGNAAITMEQRDESECTVCYDLRTGAELWCHREQVRFHSEHGDGPRSTPSIEGNRVVSVGATGLMTCVDLKYGQLQWKQPILLNPSTENQYFGTTGSPWIIENEVVVTPGNGVNRGIVAYALENGEQRWGSGDDPASYASVSMAKVCATQQFISFNGIGLRAYSRTGESLWFVPWLTQGESRVNVAQPVVVQSSDTEALVLISSGYEMGTSLIRITRTLDEWKTETVWISKNLKSKFSNFVVVDQHVYGLDNGLMTCIRLSDGERCWKKGRYGHGQLLQADGKIFVQMESGGIALVQPNATQHVELARLDALSDKTWNHPTLVGNILLVRNDREAVAFELQTDVNVLQWQAGSAY